jgi:hypothetical protein
MRWAQAASTARKLLMTHRHSLAEARKSSPFFRAVNYRRYDLRETGPIRAELAGIYEDADEMVTKRCWATSDGASWAPLTSGDLDRKCLYFLCSETDHPDGLAFYFFSEQDAGAFTLFCFSCPTDRLLEALVATIGGDLRYDHWKNYGNYEAFYASRVGSGLRAKQYVDDLSSVGLPLHWATRPYAKEAALVAALIRRTRDSTWDSVRFMILPTFLGGLAYVIWRNWWSR